MATKSKAKSSKKKALKKRATKKVSPKKKPVKQIKIKKLKAPDLSLKSVKKKTLGVYKKYHKLFVNLGWVLVGILSLMLVDYLVQYINNDMSVAVVNNSRVSRREYYKRLEQESGQSVVSALIREELIYQEAKTKGVDVTSEEIQREYDINVERFGGEKQFTEALSAYNLTPETYKESIYIELLIAKALVEEPTEEQVAEFFQANKESYFVNLDSYEDDYESVERTYVKAQLEEVFPTWVQGAMEDSVIQDNIEDKPDYMMFKATRNIFNNLYSQVTDLMEEAAK